MPTMNAILEFVAVDGFGHKQVVFEPDLKLRKLLHDGARHGYQSTDPKHRLEPLAYYHRAGPCGDVFAAFRMADTSPRVAVIGLGIGSMAAYARPGEHFTFYEIDAGIARLARDPRLFSFLERCEGTCDVVIGDGLAGLGEAPDHHFGLIVADAFVGDAIPDHLLTPEAFQLYRGKLADGGLIAFHASNVHRELGPVIGRHADAAGMICFLRDDLDVSDEDRAGGKLPSRYLIVAGSRHEAGFFADDPNWNVTYRGGDCKAQ